MGCESGLRRGESRDAMSRVLVDRWLFWSDVALVESLMLGYKRRGSAQRPSRLRVSS